MRKAILVHQEIVPYNGIGHDICRMYRILQRGFDTFVYGDDVLYETLARVNKDELLAIIACKDSLLIYYHHRYWKEGEEILELAKAKVIVKFHNLPRAAYFKPYNEKYYCIYRIGREQTSRILRNHPDVFRITNSYYDLEDTGIAGSSNTAVLPPFNNVSMWQNLSPEDKLLQSLLEDSKISLLTVGDMTPDKDHRFLFETIKDYVQHYGSDIVLYMIGKKVKGLRRYYRELEKYIARNKLRKHIVWEGEVSESKLLAFFLGCHYFLNMSQHEGFCAPAILAQSLHLPVIARYSKGMAETLGAEQLLLNKDNREYSTAIHTLFEHEEYMDYLVEKGEQNYCQRFSNRVIEDAFVQIVQNVTEEVL